VLAKKEDGDDEGGDEGGHYEKVEKQCTKYYYVKGKEPSGIPDALVVSGEEEEQVKKAHEQ